MSVEPYIGEIVAFSFKFAPKGWATCNGQTLTISQNQALFSIIGIIYGGDGVTNFKLPNLAGAVPLHVGTARSGIQYQIGQIGGEEQHSLTIAEMPAHYHQMRADAASPASGNAATPSAGNAIGQSIGQESRGGSFEFDIYSNVQSNMGLMASQSIANAGGGAGHENRQPFLALNYCIALTGVFPSRP